MMPRREVELPVGLPAPGGRRIRRVSLRPIRVREERALLDDFRVHVDPDHFLLLALERTLEVEGFECVPVAWLQELALRDLRVLERAYRSVNDYPEDLEEACFDVQLDGFS